MKIEQRESPQHFVAIPDDGMVLTFFRDGDRPDTYNGASAIHSKDMASFLGLREITIEQHKAYKKAADEYRPEEEIQEEI
jgi:hypothetical protein